MSSRQNTVRRMKPAPANIKVYDTVRQQICYVSAMCLFNDRSGRFTHDLFYKPA